MEVILAVDVHRLNSQLLVLRPKSRTAFEQAATTYAEFAALYNSGQYAPAWPKLAELLWALQSVERSDDWEARDAIGPGMLAAAQDLEARLVERFAEEAA